MNENSIVRLIGKPLGHSYSPEIHAVFGRYRYLLTELEEGEVGSFLRSGEFDALNVTIPYKKTVMPFLDELTPEARRIGSVNTVTRLPGGGLRGDNTDYFGFSVLLNRLNVPIAGKKVVILGSGGASMTVRTVAADRGAREIVIVSRTGENNYGNLERHADAEILVNSTPVGMYPQNGASPVQLRRFPRLEAVADLIYNPAKTALILEAEERGIPCRSGLTMLVAQACAASERFTGLPVPPEEIERITALIESRKKNVALIGMPGCGKTSVGRALAAITGRTFVDLDEEIERIAGKPAAQIIVDSGEARFRELETEVLARFSAESSLILATGGGAVLRPENRRLLRQNSTAVLLLRPLGELASEGRPLSQGITAEELWNQRKESYLAAQDITVESSATPEGAAEHIREALQL